MKIIIRQPDGFHVHLRIGALMAKVIFFTSYVFKRALVMGNLIPPIRTAEDAIRYKNEILSYPVPFHDFEPIMTIMLVNGTTIETITGTHKAGINVIKLIPGGTSTNSKDGVSLENLRNYYPVLRKAKDLRMVFSSHWELVADPETGQEIPHLKREERAIPYLLDLLENVPGLKVVVEHVSTSKMIEVVKNQPDDVNIFATITAHHPFLTIDDVMRGDEIYNPHHFCLPIAKTEDDRQAVVEAMISGNARFFFGSDSSPHYAHKKKFSIAPPENRNPPAGIFTAPVELPLLADIFERNNALDRLDPFVSGFGAMAYGLPLNSGALTLEKKKWRVPYDYEGIQIFRGGTNLNWQVI